MVHEGPVCESGKLDPPLATNIISPSLLGRWNNRVCIYIYAKGQISLEFSFGLNSWHWKIVTPPYPGV